MTAYEQLSDPEKAAVDALENELDAALQAATRPIHHQSGHRAKLAALRAKLEMSKESADRLGLLDVVTEIANRL